MYLNDRALSDYGFRLVSVSQWIDQPPFAIGPSPLLGRSGGALIAQTGTVETRTIETVLATARGTTLVTRRSLASSLYQACQGVVALRFDDDATKQVYATLTTAAAQALAIAMLDGDVGVTLTWLCADPYWYATTTTSIAFPSDGTRVPVPMGSAPHGGVIHLAGAGTNPCTLTLRDVTGTTLNTMTLATTWTSAEYVEIDLDRCRIEKINNVTRTNILTYLGTTEDFLSFSPEDTPTLAVSGCTGGVLYYRKAWLA